LPYTTLFRSLFRPQRARLRGHGRGRAQPSPRPGGERLPPEEVHQHPRRQPRRERHPHPSPRDDPRAGSGMDRRGRARRGHAQEHPHPQARARLEPAPQDGARPQAHRRLAAVALPGRWSPAASPVNLDPMKRALRILGIGLLSLIVLVVGGSAAVYYLVGFDRLVDEAIAQALPSVEEALGRKVRVGAVKTGFFPTLSVEVPQIAVSGAEGEPDLFSASAVEVDVALWKALFSFGKTLEIGDVRVREPRVVVLRRADGSLSIDDLLSAREKEPAPETEERPAAWPENLRIGRIRIESGALYLVDAEKLGDDGDLRQAALSYVEAIDLGVENLGLRERIAVEVSLAALAPQKNFRLAFQAGPLDSIPPEGIPPLRDLRIEASEFALRSVGAFLGEAGRPLEEARLTAELAIPALVPGEPIRVDGKLAVAGLRMDGGSPVDLRTVIAAGIDLEAGDVEIGSL